MDEEREPANLQAPPDERLQAINPDWDLKNLNKIRCKHKFFLYIP